MAQITGVDFVSVSCIGESIARAGTAGYWLDVYSADDSVVSMHRQGIIQKTRELADLLGFDLVERPAKTETT